MEVIGAYKIVSTLAAGKRPVYLATAKDGKKVVIKTAPVKDLGDEERARFDVLARGHVDALHAAGAGRTDFVFHLHRFDHDETLPDRDDVSG